MKSLRNTNCGLNIKIFFSSFKYIKEIIAHFKKCVVGVVTCRNKQQHKKQEGRNKWKLAIFMYFKCHSIMLLELRL
jgi:hypothetical protein